MALAPPSCKSQSQFLFRICNSSIPIAEKIGEKKVQSYYYNNNGGRSREN
jgi:hypothetical protein